MKCFQTIIQTNFLHYNERTIPFIFFTNRLAWRILSWYKKYTFHIIVLLVFRPLTIKLQAQLILPMHNIDKSMGLISYQKFKNNAVIQGRLIPSFNIPQFDAGMTTCYMLLRFQSSLNCWIYYPPFEYFIKRHVRSPKKFVLASLHINIHVRKEHCHHHKRLCGLAIISMPLSSRRFTLQRIFSVSRKVSVFFSKIPITQKRSRWSKICDDVSVSSIYFFPVSFWFDVTQHVEEAILFLQARRDISSQICWTQPRLYETGKSKTSGIHSNKTTYLVYWRCYYKSTKAIYTFHDWNSYGVYDRLKQSVIQTHDAGCLRSRASISHFKSQFGLTFVPRATPGR